MTLYAAGGVHPKGPYDNAGGKGPLLVVDDQTRIYESGNLYNVGIDDILQNPVAVRMVLNDLNCARAELDELRAAALPPGFSFVLAFFNALGVVVLAIGVNLFTANPESWIGPALTAVGGGGSILSSAAPGFAAWMSKREHGARSR